MHQVLWGNMVEAFIPNRHYVEENVIDAVNVPVRDAMWTMLQYTVVCVLDEAIDAPLLRRLLLQNGVGYPDELVSNDDYEHAHVIDEVGEQVRAALQRVQDFFSSDPFHVRFIFCVCVPRNVVSNTHVTWDEYSKREYLQTEGNPRFFGVYAHLPWHVVILAHKNM